MKEGIGSRDDKVRRGIVPFISCKALDMDERKLKEKEFNEIIPSSLLSKFVSTFTEPPVTWSQMFYFHI